MLDMRLSARADYALRAAIELAATERNHITAEQLARAQRIPAKFLEAILTQLRRADLVRSQRGPEGGFWLARPAADISLADIIRAIDGPLVGVPGEPPGKVGGSCTPPRTAPGLAPCSRPAASLTSGRPVPVNARGVSGEGEVPMSTAGRLTEAGAFSTGSLAPASTGSLCSSASAKLSDTSRN